MSTLPFLLSVADELDNLNSQTYMDDFGLGFHPHRHYYRNPNPSIQLSLPASTDWIEEKQRCRSHKFVDDTQNNADDDADESSSSSNHTSSRRAADQDNIDSIDQIDSAVQMYNISKKCRKYNHAAGAGAGSNTTTSTSKAAASSCPPSSSSSDESLQKTSTLSALASIEFLTCFPVKKNKAPKCSSSASHKKS